MTLHIPVGLNKLQNQLLSLGHLSSFDDSSLRDFSFIWLHPINCFTQCFTASKFKHELMFLSMCLHTLKKFIQKFIYTPGGGTMEKVRGSIPRQEQWGVPDKETIGWGGGMRGLQCIGGRGRSSASRGVPGGWGSRMALRCDIAICKWIQ